MEKNTANTSYANDEFEVLLQEKSNKYCFDCGNTPATWASVNNSIYLCLNCAGNHRGFGVNISYIRSITIDTWNETQMKYMKLGGNKRIEELLSLFEVPKSTTANVLYASKLLDYHRSQIKSEVNNGKQLIPPRIDEALIPIDSLRSNEESQKKSNIYSVGSTSEDLKPETGPQGGLISSVGSMFKNVVNKTKDVAYNVKEKAKDYEITNRIVNTGSKAIEAIKESTYKGVEVLKDTTSKGVEAIKDRTAQGVEILKDTSGKVIAKGYEVGVFLY